MNLRWVAVIAALGMAGCVDGRPIVLSSSNATSPDGRWQATLERIDNGMGFGQGLVIYEIHLQPAASRIEYHGGESATCIFWIDADSATDEPIVEWRGARQLEVKYATSHSPGRKVAAFMDVSIDYQLGIARDVR